MTHPLMAELIELANFYGQDPEYSRAGGGNASVKIDGVLYIKPSGVPLATLTAADLVPLDNTTLQGALTADPPAGGDPVRQAAAAAQRGSADGPRPSVELLFHALIDDPLVVHTHPLVANALSCNSSDDALLAELIGDDAVLVPYADPGLPLATAIWQTRQDYQTRTGRAAPGITVLANHGVIASGMSAAQVIERTARLTTSVRRAIDATVAVAAPPLPADAHAMVQIIAPTLRGLLGSAASLAVVSTCTDELARAVTASRAGQVLVESGPLIPDQIVYAGSFPVVITPGDDPAAATTAAVAAYRDRYGRDPNVAVLPGLAVCGIGPDVVAAELARDTYLDALRVARDADRIGSVRSLSAPQRQFIENWEAESYRKSVAAQAHSGRLTGKIALITGAAQGFGLGIAGELIGQGAHVLLADLNIDLARREASALCATYGARRALAVHVDVSDEQSCLQMAADVVTCVGGCDIFISNAGVLRADGVMNQPVADFDLVTQVNYRGYFLGVRAMAPVMAAQRAARPTAWFDIIEINSKSGLEGSKRNFAYAGSKFGGIGLTQSFALELVEYGIKVNAICPGNYLDGPLWADPDRGLFVQYLRAGKVPGATSIADVRAFYEDKVPMRRGCYPADLARAIYYVVEQQYETGQALPVTGGQIMLG